MESDAPQSRALDPPLFEVVGNSLDWKEQIKVISSKVSKALDLLKHAKTFLPESSVRLNFRYCCSVWGYSGSNTFRAAKTAK